MIFGRELPHYQAIRQKWLAVLRQLAAPTVIIAIMLSISAKLKSSGPRIKYRGTFRLKTFSRSYWDALQMHMLKSS